MSKLTTAELGNVPELDLHGMSVDEAVRSTENFLYSEQNKGTEAVRIICGRGTGSLHKSLMNWLDGLEQSKDLVEEFSNSNLTHQQGGVILIALTPLN